MIRGRTDSLPCWISVLQSGGNIVMIVSLALIGVGLFEMSLNAIVNRSSVLSYDTIRIQPKTSWSKAVALSAEPAGQVLVLLNALQLC